MSQSMSREQEALLRRMRAAAMRGVGLPAGQERSAIAQLLGADDGQPAPAGPLRRAAQGMQDAFNQTIRPQRPQFALPSPEPRVADGATANTDDAQMRAMIARGELSPRPGSRLDGDFFADNRMREMIQRGQLTAESPVYGPERPDMPAPGQMRDASRLLREEARRIQEREQVLRAQFRAQPNTPQGDVSRAEIRAQLNALRSERSGLGDQNAQLERAFDPGRTEIQAAGAQADLIRQLIEDNNDPAAAARLAARFASQPLPTRAPGNPDDAAGIITDINTRERGRLAREDRIRTAVQAAPTDAELEAEARSATRAEIEARTRLAGTAGAIDPLTQIQIDRARTGLERDQFELERLRNPGPLTVAERELQLENLRLQNINLRNQGEVAAIEGDVNRQATEVGAGIRRRQIEQTREFGADPEQVYSLADTAAAIGRRLNSTEIDGENVERLTALTRIRDQLDSMTPRAAQEVLNAMETSMGGFRVRNQMDIGGFVFGGLSEGRARRAEFYRTINAIAARAGQPAPFPQFER